MILQHYVQRNIESKLMYRFTLKLNKRAQFPSVVLGHRYQPLFEFVDYSDAVQAPPRANPGYEHLFSSKASIRLSPKTHPGASRSLTEAQPFRARKGSSLRSGLPFVFASLFFVLFYVALALRSVPCMVSNTAAERYQQMEKWGERAVVLYITRN